MGAAMHAPLALKPPCDDRSTPRGPRHEAANDFAIKNRFAEPRRASISSVQMNGPLVLSNANLPSREVGFAVPALSTDRMCAPYRRQMRNLSSSEEDGCYHLSRSQEPGAETGGYDCPGVHLSVTQDIADD